MLEQILNSPTSGGTTDNISFFQIKRNGETNQFFKGTRERNPSLRHTSNVVASTTPTSINQFIEILPTIPTQKDTASSEEDLLRGAHGGLEVDLADVLPLLLEKRGEEVNGQLGVDDDLLLVHVGVADGDVEAHDLLHLELDGGLDLVDLLLHVLLGGEKGGELAGLGETGAEETGDLLDHVVGGEEEVVTLGELLDELLVLVELLEVLNAHVIDADAVGLLAMDGITEDAALEVRAGNGGELEGSGETLLASGIVVLEGDLALDGLDEVALLALELLSGLGDGPTGGEGKDVGDRLVKEGGVQLVGHGCKVRVRVKGASTE
mmetsp:Transcript_20154/g.57818  ORF Transcript_20154/g.57818 Transcript_20154/m.57818 type:complete len:322 (-) Transcript_20154:262-1227(-)